MRLQLKRIKGVTTDREIDNLIISEGTVTYFSKNNEYGVDFENINYLIVTDPPDANAADLQAENTVLREALVKADVWVNLQGNYPGCRPAADAMLGVIRAALAGGE